MPRITWHLKPIPADSFQEKQQASHRAVRKVEVFSILVQESLQDNLGPTSGFLLLGQSLNEDTSSFFDTHQRPHL